MKKLSTKNVFASVITACLFLLFLESCQKEMQVNDLADAKADIELTKSTIIYTDITPDVTKTDSDYPSYYYLDLNNDGTTDFEIAAYVTIPPHGFGPSIIGVNIYSFNKNRVACDSLPLAMNQNDIIGSHLNWVSITSPIDSATLRKELRPANRWWGNWADSTDHYLGLKIKQGSSTYYGWARLNVSVVFGKSSVTIKDYAYNGIPNQRILAGQMK